MRRVFAFNTGLRTFQGSNGAASVRESFLVDVVNSPSFDDEPVLNFFTNSSANLVAAAKATGVEHYVALSIVASGLPYTTVRATEFQEFAGAITDSLVVGDEVRTPDALIQLIAAADVSTEVARASAAAPVNGTAAP